MDEKILELNNLVEFKNNASQEIIRLEEKSSRIEAENNELRITIDNFNGLKPAKNSSESTTNIVTQMDKFNYDDLNGYAQLSGDKLCNKNEFPIAENHNDLSTSSENPSNSNLDLRLNDDMRDASNKDVLPPKLGHHNEMLYTNGQ